MAKCCQDKGLLHCGECLNIPEKCTEKVCAKIDKTSVTPCEGCDKTTSGKLHAYSYTDPNNGDNPSGQRVEQCKKWKIIAELTEINIPELKSIEDLNILKGDYINLECQLPNGEKRKILDDNRQYYCTEVSINCSEKCYGVAADEGQIAIFKYGCKGVDAELVCWRKR